MALTENFSAGSVSVPTTTETAAITSPVLSLPPTPNGVVVRGNVNITAGTAATSVTVRVRQGSGTGGTAVGNAQVVTVAAGLVYDLAIEVEDTSGPPSAQYTITVQQGAATGNGTINQAEIETDLVVP
jgi:hypothetical protein